MEIKIVVDAPKGWKRRVLLYVVTPVALVAATALIARAMVLPVDAGWIEAGAPVSASDLASDFSAVNTNFGNLDNRVSTLETQRYSLAPAFSGGGYALRGTSTVATGSGTWSNVPMTTLNVTIPLSGALSVDLLANGIVYAADYQGGAGAGAGIGCAVRFVVDGAAQNAGAFYGNAYFQSVLGPNQSTWSTLTASETVTGLSPGAHTISLQLSIAYSTFATPACELQSDSGFVMTATVH